MQTNARKKAKTSATSAEQSTTSAQQRSQRIQTTLHAFFKDKDGDVLGGDGGADGGNAGGNGGRGDMAQAQSEASTPRTT